MLFPRHASDSASILGPKWHFRNYEPHNGIFVNIHGHNERTTNFRSHLEVASNTFHILHF